MSRYVLLSLFCVANFGFLSAPALSQSAPGDAVTPPPAQTQTAADIDKEQKAEQQIKQQEHQRILGIFPEFNTSQVPDAVPLTRKQKIRLAFASAVDPASFAIAAVDGGWSQLNNDYAGYGQGAQGYFKRFGAAYADSFDGTMIGNAFLPALLHQDPRYFRKGIGSVKSRIWYAALTTVRCKDDSGRWDFNYSNIAGNFIAGGISNLYYPSTDRGAGLTAQRALTVSAEGALGAMFFEFWPDISHHFKKKHDSQP